MLKTEIGHVTVVDCEESTTIIGITHGLAWENLRSVLTGGLIINSLNAAYGKFGYQ